MAAWTSQRTGDWSRTSDNADSPWHDGGVQTGWASVPANTDTVSVANTHTVTFDVDQSGFANGVDITIDAGGIIDVETAAGSYYLKCNADLKVNGDLKAGTDTTTTLSANVSFEIELNGAFSIEGANTGTALLYCVEPTYKWVRLSGAEAAGQTVWSVDTDVTGDIWADGDEIAIVDWATNGIEDIERRTIAGGGIAATTITVTAGLTNAKLEGAYIALLSRNITISGSSTYAYEDLEDSEVYAFVDSTSGSYSCDNFTIGGSMYLTGYYIAYSCRIGGVSLDGAFVSDGLGSDAIQASYDVSSTDDTLIGGFSTGIDNSFGVVYDGVIAGGAIAFDVTSNGAMNGSIWGCYTGFQNCSDIYVTGDVFTHNNGFIRGSGGIIVSNCEIDSGYCLLNVGSMTCYNVLFTASFSEFSGYNENVRTARSHVVSYNHDQVTNAEKGWDRGGIYVSDTSAPLPTGETIKYIFTAEDTTQTYPVYREFKTDVQPGTSLEVEAYLAIPNGEDMTGYAPKLQFIDAYDDPLVDSTASPLDEDEIPISDGTETGFQTVSCIYANQGSAPKTVYVRILVQHDGGGNDVIIYGAWSIADYKNQINALYTNLSSFISVGAAINTPPKAAPDGFDITTGVNETNDEDSTHSLDGTVHSIDSTGGLLDVYYEFSIGGDGVPVSTTLTGYLNGNNDDLEVYAYNWVTSGWDQIGELEGKTLSTDDVHSYDLFTGHVGTGANIGTVRIRFTDGAFTLTSATLAVDQIYVSYSIANRSVGYANGRIWVDTTGSNTNTESYVDGTADNPVSTWAAALTLSTALNLDRFNLSAGSSITLTASSDNYDIIAYGATVALGGMSVSGCLIEGGTVTGNDDGSNTLPIRLRNCKLTTNTLGKFRMNQCPLSADITIAEASTYILEGCLSAVAGTSTPSIDFGAAIGDTNLNMRHYSGGIEIKNMGQTGTDNMSLEGHGQLVIASTCIGGTIAIRGHFTVTDNSGGLVTLSNEAMFDHNSIIDGIHASLGQVHTVEDEIPGGGGGASTTSGIAEGC